VSRVSSFAGLLFDPMVAGPLERLTTPPYDTISAPEQRRFREASPHNVIHLVLGEDLPGDDGSSNKYRRAASALETWREEGVLVAPPGPAFFVYEMRFSFRGKSRRVRGLICAVELEDWGGSIVPHERTMAGPVEDRLLLMRAVRANLSPIYAVFSGPCRHLSRSLDDVCERPPVAAMTDESGVEHRMWILVDAGEIAPWLADESLLIADGHHRYTMALRYRDEMRSDHGPGPWDRVMMFIVDAAEEDPPVLPIHRMLMRGTPPTDGSPVRGLEEVLAQVNDDELRYGVATREDSGLIHRVAQLTGEPPLVRVLHQHVLDDSDEALEFTHDPIEAEEAVRDGRAVAAYFLPATSAERIRSVIDRGERLPQKSTFFWPKPRTGMIIRPLD
jgi:uncharacterized protein (DUF1015 family)